MNIALGKTAGNPYSPSQLSQHIKKHLESEIEPFWLMGEISDYYLASSGHQYFTIKDNNSTIRCVFFNFNNREKIHFKVGNEILALSQPTLYTRRGDLQLNILRIQEKGIGLLTVKYQQLKFALEKIGLFDKHNKQDIPRHINNIGLITSKDGAALQDILEVIKSKNPFINISIYHSLVQGDQAAQQLIMQLTKADKQGHDLLLISRGGGSTEDLWCFNDENLCMQIFNTKTPVVTAIGHQTDESLADLVADKTCSTPTAAAEYISGEILLSYEILKHSLKSITQQMQHVLLSSEQRLDKTVAQLKAHHPHSIIQQQQKLLQHQYTQLKNQINKKLVNSRYRINLANKQLQPPEKIYINCKNKLRNQHQKLQQLTKQNITKSHYLLCQTMIRLDNNSPLKILQQGYSHTTHIKTSQTIMSSQQLKIGSVIITRLKSGKIVSEVKELYESENI